MIIDIVWVSSRSHVNIQTISIVITVLFRVDLMEIVPRYMYFINCGTRHLVYPQL